MSRPREKGLDLLLALAIAAAITIAALDYFDVALRG